MADDMAKFAAKMTKKDRIVALKEHGYSNRQIADAVECHDAYVRAALQRHKEPAGNARRCAAYYAANRQKWRVYRANAARKRAERKMQEASA